jgi:tRNA dimethylallyltransferase
LAYAAIEDIVARGRLPFLVGGAGQYVHAVTEGWRFPAAAPQPAVRAALQAEADLLGPEALHARLAALDPVAAARIDYRNVRRVIRALEVCLATGQPMSDLQRKAPPPYALFQIGVTRPRPELFARIDARVDQMVADGLVGEVGRLIAAGYSPDLPAMSGIGYRQIGQYLRGAMSLEAAVALIKKQTRRFVHQQSVWFRANDPAIRWIHPDQMPLADLQAMLEAWLADHGFAAAARARVR